MKLIPNNISVSEQFAIRNKLTETINRWLSTRFRIDKNHYWSIQYNEYCLDILENECGIRCHLHNGNNKGVLTGFVVTNQEKYLWFSLKEY